MKRILSTLLAASLMLLGTQAFAQVSVNAGYLNSTRSYSNSSENANGGYAGVSFNLPIAGGFAIAPGVYYSLITGKTLDLGSIASGTLTEHAINVPAYLNYSLGLNRDTKFFVYAGPTFQYGLASTVKYSSGLVSGSVDTDNYKNSDYNRMNVYLGGGIGINAGGFIVNVGYDYGMMNQYKGENATQAHRSNLKIGVGYEF